MHVFTSVGHDAGSDKWVSEAFGKASPSLTESAWRGILAQLSRHHKLVSKDTKIFSDNELGSELFLQKAHNMNPEPHPDLSLSRFNELSDVSFVGSMVANEIRRIRTECGLTQAQLAENAGMKPSVIARLENPASGGHTTTSLMQIARALGCELVISFKKLEKQ